MKKVLMTAFAVSLIAWLVAGCVDVIEQQRRENNYNNYEKMHKDIINIIMQGTQEDVKISAKIEQHFIVYYYEFDGKICRVPINVGR